MLNFRPICAEDYDVAAPIMKSMNFGSTESSFVDLYIWSDMYNTQICIEDGTVFFRAGNGEGTRFLFPYGGDLKTALTKIRETAKESGVPCAFFAITGRMRDMINEVFPDEFSFSETRDYFDYIYNSSDLISLSGKKYHQKRNHVNKFLKLFGERYVYEEIGKENISEVLAFQEKWLNTALDGERDKALKKETDGIVRVLSDMSRFDIKGGIIRVDGEVAAYSLGTQIADDTFVVMAEKGDYNFDGIYQIMNKLFAERNCKDIKYINREDDTGSEGLRHAKLSYYPTLLLKKYDAIWKK